MNSIDRKDVDEIVEYLWKRNDLLKALFPKSANKLRKHHLPSIFLQLVGAGIITFMYSPGDKKNPNYSQH